MSPFLVFWILSLLIKLGLSAILPLSPDEAYYWIWSKHLQLSYYDHPPAVAWLLYLGQWTDFGGQSIRWPTAVVGHLSFLVWYEILKTRFPWEKFKYWFLLALLSPLVGFGSFIATPDVPVILFWSLSILFTLRALSEKELCYYILLGASLGLGFCSKYHIVIFVPILLIYLTFEKQWKNVSLKGILSTIAFGFIFSLPVLIWNLQNDFVSFKFQIDHGLGESTWNPQWTVNYVVGEILLIFPFLLWVALRTKINGPLRLLYYFGWGPFLFFLFSSFRGAVELNWPAIAFPSVFAILLFAENYKRVFKWTLGFWLCFYAFVFIAIEFFPPKNPVAKPFRDLTRFRPLASLQEKYKPLYAGTYQIASTIWYENRTPIYKLRDMSRYDFYDTLPQSLPAEESFYLIQEDWTDMPAWVTQAGYKTEIVEKIEPHYYVVKVSK